jgi:hypothetical protein
MLPVLVSHIIYYFFTHVDAVPDDDLLNSVKKKYYPEVISDGLFGVWFMNKDINIVTWTLAIELWASFYVFIVSETVVFYSARWVQYLALLLFLFIPIYTDKYELTDYGVHYKDKMTL